MNDEVNNNKGSDRDMWGMRTTGRRAAAIALAAVALVIQGCAIAPGQTMNSSGKLPEGKVVRVQELTTDLLNQLEAAHATEVRELAEQFAVRHEEYLIGPGDVVQVTVWDHPELTIPPARSATPRPPASRSARTATCFTPMSAW